MNVGITTAKRLSATALALLFCAGFMGESLHYAWVQHERCATHGEWVHGDTHQHTPASSHAHDHHHGDHSHFHSHQVVDTSKTDHQLPQVIPSETDNHDHCSLGDFTREDDTVAWQVSATQLSPAPIIIEAILISNANGFLPFAILHLAPKHAPPGYVA